MTTATAMLSIVIPAFGQLERLRLALRSIIAAVRCDRAKAEIIAVNDGGCDEMSAIVHRTRMSFPALTEVRTCRGGRSVARNAGARQARGQRLLFLDGDVLPGRGALAAHARYGTDCPGALVRGSIAHLPWLAAFQDPAAATLTPAAQRSLGHAAGHQTAAVQQRRLALDGDGLPDGRTQALSRMRRFERDLHAWLRDRPIGATGRWIGSTGGNLSVSRADFERVGGFDERMGLRWGAEDLEFGYRCERAAMPLVHAGDALVYHMDHGASPDRESDHRAALDYFASKHGDPRVRDLQQYFFGTASLPEVMK